MVETTLPAQREWMLSVSKSNQEPDWLLQRRTEALELAGQLDNPKLEKTRIDRWDLQSYGTYKTVSEVQSLSDLPDHIQGLIESFESDNLLVQIDSGVSFVKLSSELSDQGVIYSDLGTACQNNQQMVEPYLNQVIKSDEHRLAAWHNALWNGGAFLYVPKNVVIEQPIQALFVSSDGTASFMPHILIVAETNSSVTYVDNVVSMDNSQPLVHHSATEVIAKEGSRVRVASVHRLHESITDVTYRRAIAEKDAHVEWIIGEMNDGNTLSDTASVLMGNGSTTNGKMVGVGSLQQKMNLTTRAVHHGLNTRSDMIARIVMKDEATAIVNGITKIEKGATNANGDQIQRILMLSPKSRGDANPVLLIDEDEVLAGHAASAGQVNQEHVHYLMSRGISEEDAKMLIIRGFLTPIISEIPLEHLKTKLSDILEGKLTR